MTNAKTKKTDATAFKHSKVDELFNLVKDQSNGRIIICVGNNKVSRKSFKTWKEADNYIATKPYEILINVSILIQKLNNDEKEKENKKDAQNA